MFCIFLDRVCVVTEESMLCLICVFTEGALVQGRIIYVLYVGGSKIFRTGATICTAVVLAPSTGRW